MCPVICNQSLSKPKSFEHLSSSPRLKLLAAEWPLETFALPLRGVYRFKRDPKELRFLREPQALLFHFSLAKPLSLHHDEFSHRQSL